MLKYIDQLKGANPTIITDTILRGIPDIIEDMRDQLWHHTFDQKSFEDVPGRVIDEIGAHWTFPLHFEPVQKLRQDVFKLFEGTDANPGVYWYLKRELGIPPDEGLPSDRIPKSLSNLDNMMGIMVQELCVQGESELTWFKLLRTMAPSCISLPGESGPVILILDEARKSIDDKAVCPLLRIDIPPHIETSFAGFTYLRNSEGGK